MKFLKLKSNHPLYRQAFDDVEIRGFELSNRQEPIGKIVDVLLDDAHQAYYLAVEVGNWLSRKQVLVPLSQFKLEPTKRRIYVDNFSKAEAERLPEYVANHVVERQPEVGVNQLENALPLEASMPLGLAPAGVAPTRSVSPVSDRFEQNGERRSDHLPSEQLSPDHLPSQPVETHRVDSNAYDRVQADAVVPARPVAANSSIVEEETIRLLEERLLVDRHRRKVGEVIVRKVIETHTVEVPVRREKLIVEQVSPEQKQLAVLDLHELNGASELDGTAVELNHPVTEESFDSVDPAGNRFTQAQSISGQPISVRLASRILNRLSSKFEQTQVKLVFSDPELQAGYQKWLAEHQDQELK
jgi:stress response protein YsnF